MEGGVALAWGTREEPGEGEGDGDGVILQPPAPEEEEPEVDLNIAGSAVYAACSNTNAEPALPLLGLLLLGLRRRRRPR